MKNLFFIGLLLPLGLYSQNLTELIDEAMHNQLINATKYKIQSQEDAYVSTQKNYMPKLYVGATYSNTNEETSTVPDDSFTAYANLNYVVYDGGKKNAIYKSYESTLQSANQNLEALKNKIMLQVITYYFNYETLLFQKEATLKKLEQLHAQYTRLQQFLEAGTTTTDEVQKIISRVEIVNVNLHEIELKIQTILHKLEYLTLKKVTITNGSTMKEYIQKEDSLRADIRAIEFDMKALLSKANVTKSANYPTLSLDNTYYKYDLNYESETYQSYAIDSQNIFTVNLSWKLYDFDSNNKAYSSALKKYKSLQSQYQYERKKASIDLKLAKKAYIIGKLKINSAQAGLKAADATYEKIEQKYQNGLVDNVTYLESLSEKYTAMSILKNAQFDLEIKKANIIYHSGKNLQEFVK